MAGVDRKCTLGASGVKTKAAARGQKRQTLGMSEGESAPENPAEESRTAIEWRTVQTELKAGVRSTLPEALAEALTLEWTVQEGEVQKPVTGEARTGEANTEPGVLTTKVHELDGVNAGDVAGGGEPSETTRRARQASGSRSGAGGRLDVQSASR